MKATVVVKPGGTPVPKTPAQAQAQALEDQTGGVVGGDRQEGGEAANTVYQGVGGRHHPRLLPAEPEGDWHDGHVRQPVAGARCTTVALRPAQYIVEQLAKQTDLLPTGPTAPNQVTPILTWGSEPKEVRLRRQEPWQRLPRHPGDRRLARRAAAESVAGDVQHARDVQGPLLDPRQGHGLQRLRRDEATAGRMPGKRDSDGRVTDGRCSGSISNVRREALPGDG